MKYILFSPIKRMTVISCKMALLPTITVLAITGCAIMPSHIHNDANAKIAAQAQTEMADYSKNAPNMYSAMLANIEKFKVEEEYLLSELATNFNTALLSKLPTLTWGEIKSRMKECDKSIENFEKQIVEEANKRKWFEKEVEDAKTAVEAAQKSAQEAKEKVTAWNAYVALIQQGFANIPKDFSELNKDRDIDALIKAVNDLGKKEITFSDADGKETKKTVGEILKNRLPSAKDWQSFKSLPDAPGITLLIMNMGLELAQIEQKRAEAQMSRFNARAALYEDAYISIQLAKQLISDARETIKTKDDDGTPFLTIAEARQSAITAINNKSPKFSKYISSSNAIAVNLVALRKEVLAESLIARNESIFKVTLARLDHQDSIYESISGDAAWRTVLRSGIDGLAAYHQSGFTKEDAANIIRIAQAFALFFIAAGIN